MACLIIAQLLAQLTYIVYYGSLMHTYCVVHNVLPQSLLEHVWQAHSLYLPHREQTQVSHCGQIIACYELCLICRGNNFRKFIDFLAQVKHGVVNGIKVRLNSLQALISTSYVENLEVSMDEETDKSLQKRLPKYGSVQFCCRSTNGAFVSPT